MQSETPLSKKILLHMSKFCTLFRNETAVAWAGKLVKQSGDTVVLANATRISAGLIKGSSDNIGWTEVVITPEMVGKKLAVFTGIEVKTATGRASKEQIKFNKIVESSGGFCYIARSPEEAETLLAERLNALKS